MHHVKVISKLNHHVLQVRVQVVLHVKGWQLLENVAREINKLKFDILGIILVCWVDKGDF